MHAYNSHPAKKFVHEEPKGFMDIDEWIKMLKRRRKEEVRRHGKQNSRHRRYVR